MSFWSISQIDAMKGIKTPHDADLKDIGDKHIDVLRKVEPSELENIATKMGAEIVDMDMGEEWCLRKQYFPGVEVNVLYQYYGDEFGIGEEDELQFLFSGDKARWVSGEDLTHFCEITVTNIELIATDSVFSETYGGEPNQMLLKGLSERSEPFFMVDEGQYKSLADFIGGTLLMSNPEKLFSISKMIFPDFTCIFWGTRDKKINFQVDGLALRRIPVYDTQRLVLMILNQCLRKIKVMMGQDAPRVCNLMFSGFYKKQNPDLFP